MLKNVTTQHGVVPHVTLSVSKGNLNRKAWRLSLDKLGMTFGESNTFV